MLKHEILQCYSEVKVQADQIKIRHDKFQDMFRNVDTSTNTEFIELRKGMIQI